MKVNVLQIEELLLQISIRLEPKTHPSPNPRPPPNHTTTLHLTQRQINNLNHSRLRQQNHPFLKPQPQHPQSLSRTPAHVNHPTANERPAIRDAHIHLTPIDQAVHAHPRTKRQRAVRSCHGVHVITFTIGSAAAVKAGAVPGRAAPLVLTGVLTGQERRAGRLYPKLFKPRFWQRHNTAGRGRRGNGCRTGWINAYRRGLGACRRSGGGYCWRLRRSGAPGQPAQRTECTGRYGQP